MINFEEFKNKKYGKLTIIDKMGRDFSEQSQVIALCECGESVTYRIGDITSGLYTSCGCDTVPYVKPIGSKPMDDITGLRFGKLTALKPVGVNNDRRIVWRCKCDCGNICVVSVKQMRSGRVESCGCKAREVLMERNGSHGHSADRLYHIWHDMKRRCYQPQRSCYSRYGGRGIKVCDEWRNDFMAFRNWAITRGYREDLSIDRIDSNGNYEPMNCKWSDDYEQSNNRSLNIKFTYNNETHTLAEWCRLYGVKYKYAYGRFRKHKDWSLERLLDLSPDITEELKRIQENNMEAYNDASIKTITGLAHMKKRPGMWGFQFSNIKGNVLMVKEVLDNSMDESMSKHKHYRIEITFLFNSNKDDYQVIIRDHGRGIPVEKLVDAVTKVFTSGKFEGSAYGNTVGTNGVAMKAIAAFSEECCVMTKRMDGFGYIRLAFGDVKDTHLTAKPIDNNPDTCGTIVMFRPDKSIVTFTRSFFKDGGLQEIIDLSEFYTMFQENTTIRIKMIDGMLPKEVVEQKPVATWKAFDEITGGSEGKVLFETDHTITPRKYVQKKFGLKKPIWELGRMIHESSSDTNPVGYDIDLFLDEGSAHGHNGFVAAINGTPIVHLESTHIAMLNTVLKGHLLDYIENEELATYFENKYQLPLSGHILATYAHGVDFIGQDKTRFENRRFGDHYRSLLRKEFNKVPIAKWETLYEAIKDHLNMEFAKYSKTAYKISKSLKGIGYTLNHIGSFYNCSSTDRTMTELFITEGDSAGGRVKAVRDDRYQAILKLRGKPFNAIRGDNKKLNQNLIYQDMVRLIGVTPNDKDLSNMNFNKIVIMTDADADGCHIVSLLIGTFYRINPLILEQGRVIITNPPLYSTLMKNQAIYLRDQDALEQSRINCVYRTLLDVYIETKQGEYTLNDDQFMSFCYLVKHIGRTVVKVANVLNIEPMILEQLIHCVDYLSVNNPDTNKIKKILGVDDVVYNKESDSIILVDSGIEVPVPLQRLQSEIRAYVLPEYERGVWKDFNMYVTTKYSDLYMHAPCTYMMLYSIFETLDTCYSIRRFKGLGEMSEQAIYYTCVDPQSRCFSVVRHVGDEKRIYDMLGADSSARKKLMDNNFIEE